MNNLGIEKCPFCFSEDVGLYERSNGMHPEFCCACRDCEARSNFIEMGKDIVISRWNQISKKS